MQRPGVKSRFKASALAAAISLMNSPLTFATEEADPAVDVEAVKLDAVTVSATRREESIQNVPAPTTTLSGSTLEAQRVQRIQDLQQYLPSTNYNYSNPRQSSLSIRGIGNNPASDGLEGSTGVYLDNVYLGRPGMAVFDLLDIEQVDLLRGPQGTLFGKNTTAGVLNITTRRPTFTPERSMETSVGNHGYVQTKGVLSGALNDQLAGRLSLYRTFGRQRSRMKHAAATQASIAATAERSTICKIGAISSAMALTAANCAPHTMHNAITVATARQFSGFLIPVLNNHRRGVTETVSYTIATFGIPRVRWRNRDDHPK
ncbi:hypothetical protein PPUN110474_39870 [Pseudomonas putida]|nr:hypothetical protein PPUN110474_39870 [Pseudomonas putida]